MPINVLCPTCQKELAAPDELAGQVAECPYCQNRFQVNSPNKANSQTVRMPIPAQRGTGKESPGLGNSGSPSGAGLDSKVSMGAPPIAASHANPPVDPRLASGKKKKSASEDKASAANRDAYPPAMPPAAAPATPPAAAQPPVAAMPPAGFMPPAGAVPPAYGETDYHPYHPAPPVVAMPPSARQAVGSVSMPVPPSVAANSPRPVSSGPLANAANKAPKPRAANRRMNRAVFKTSDTAKSQVHLGADGRLPELQLEEGVVTERPAEEKKQTNPMLLLAVLGFSVGMSVLMLLYEGSSEAGANQSKVKAREIITERYMNGNPLEPYQILLREALQANARGKFDLERRRYRNVLDMLHSEGKSKMEGLTGLAEPAANNPSAPNDRELERQLSILLAD